jgi:hypothetical protein
MVFGFASEIAHADIILDGIGDLSDPLLQMLLVI